MALLVRVLAVSVVVSFLSTKASAQLGIAVNPNPPSAGSGCTITATGGVVPDCVISVWYQGTLHTTFKTQLGVPVDFQIPSGWVGGFEVGVTCARDACNEDVPLN